MKLKTIKPHANPFGDAREKKPDDVYEASPDAAQALIANGYCKEFKAAPDEKPSA